MAIGIEYWSGIMTIAILVSIRLVRAVVKDIAIGAKSSRIVFWAGQVGHNVANGLPFTRNCVAQALSRGDGPLPGVTGFGVILRV